MNEACREAVACGESLGLLMVPQGRHGHPRNRCVIGEFSHSAAALGMCTAVPRVGVKLTRVSSARPTLTPPPPKSYGIAYHSKRHRTSKTSGKEGRCELVCDQRIDETHCHSETLLQICISASWRHAGATGAGGRGGGGGVW